MEYLNSSQHEECLKLSYFSIINTNSIWIKRTSTFFWFMFLMCGATKISEIFLSSIEQILKRINSFRLNASQFNLFYDITIRTVGYNYFEILYPLIHIIENGLNSPDSGYITLILVIFL